MKIAFCVEYYSPSIGGAQEVVRQLAERMLLKGHDVTVVTSMHASRATTVLNGVKIVDFTIGGNGIEGMHGAVEAYQQYIIDGRFDLICIYAAQQWACDALLPVLDRVAARKVLIPCGFSALGRPDTRAYFDELARYVTQFDLLVFHTEKGRDFLWAVQHGLTRLAVIPNGADGEEFTVPKDAGFRARHGIGAEDFLVLTVGTITGGKGHLELAKALALMPEQTHRVHLLLNGNRPLPGPFWSGFVRGARDTFRGAGAFVLLKYVVAALLNWLGIRKIRDSLLETVAALERNSGNKRVSLCNLPRQELVQAYLNADLFAFASSFEYSPLVLFEACAAGLPFLSAPVGNAREIADWTGGGRVYEVADSGDQWRIVTDPAVLAAALQDLMADKDLLQAYAAEGLQASRARFNWRVLTEEYEQTFADLCAKEG